MNPYALRHKILSLARLPIPPLPRNWKIISVRGVRVNKMGVAVIHLLTGENECSYYSKALCSLQYNHRIRLFLEFSLSRIINTDSAGKERTRFTKSIVLAVRGLAQQTGPGAESRDLAAFISLALAIVAETIDVSVAAWEKRGYWVKADRFRMDWAWTGQFSEKMRQAVQSDDWAKVAEVAALTAQKLNKVTIPVRNRLGKPWVGAWEELKKR